MNADWACGIHDIRSAGEKHLRHEIDLHTLSSCHPVLTRFFFGPIQSSNSILYFEGTKSTPNIPPLSFRKPRNNYISIESSVRCAMSFTHPKSDNFLSKQIPQEDDVISTIISLTKMKKSKADESHLLWWNQLRLFEYIDSGSEMTFYETPFSEKQGHWTARSTESKAALGSKTDNASLGKVSVFQDLSQSEDLVDTTLTWTRYGMIHVRTHLTGTR